MKLNTIIRLPDGREGTICYHHLDGYGGVWGRHVFELPDSGFGDGLPAPDFMLRWPDQKDSLVRFHKPDLECVGRTFEVVATPTTEDRGDER